MESPPSLRFSRNQRLLDAASFDRVFKKAHASRDNWFTVLARRNTLRRARLGLAISKKHCRKATGRNRIKRIVRESFRLHQAELNGYDVVVLNKPRAATAARATLRSSLAAHWQRLNKRATGSKNANNNT